MRGIPSGLALALAIGLSGCVTATSVGTGVDATGRRAFLQYAGADTPVLLVAVNSPAVLGERVAAPMAEAAEGAVIGSVVTFTADAGAARLDQYRIVALFDPEPSVAADRVCEAVGRPPVAARYADRTTLHMAFCARTEAIAGARIRGDKLTGPDDPELREMVRAGMIEMFPPPDGDDRNDPPVFSSLTFEGGAPRFRLNPLGGLLGE